MSVELDDEEFTVEVIDAESFQARKPLCYYHVCLYLRRRHRISKLICLPLCLSMCLPVYLYLLFIYLLTYLLTYLFAYLLIYLYLFTGIYFSFHPSSSLHRPSLPLAEQQPILFAFQFCHTCVSAIVVNFSV